jgi:hypothetical protein
MGTPFRVNDYQFDLDRLRLLAITGFGPLRVPVQVTSTTAPTFNPSSFWEMLPELQRKREVIASFPPSDAAFAAQARCVTPDRVGAPKFV